MTSSACPQQQQRYGKAEHLRGLQIEDELEFGRLRGKGSVGGILAFQEASIPLQLLRSPALEKRSRLALE